MEQNIPWEQLAKYFAGELTREETQKMESWIKEDPEREQQMHKLYEVWKESGIPPYQLDVDEAWYRLSGNMDKLEEEQKRADQALPGVRGMRIAGRSTQKDRRVRQPGGVMRRIAMGVAVAATILIAGLFTYHYNFESKKEITNGIGIRQLVAREGERATYVLSDGTRIVLHAGSRLEVPIRYNVDKRELFLEGEAYFEAAHDSTKPFIVHSEQAYTRVLGTRFLVQAWPDAEGAVKVVVSEGKVALGNSRLPDTADKKEAIITRNQKGVLTGDKEPVVTDNVDLNWYLGWTRGRLKFNNRPFGEIISQLERWYAVKITTADQSIDAKKLTAEIDYSQPMGEVLKGIALSLDLELEKEGRTVTFRPKEQEN